MDKELKRMQFQGGITQDVWSSAELVLKTRFLEAIEAGVSRYPIYRELRFAARQELDDLLDSLATAVPWTVQRFDSRTLVMESDDALVSVHGSRKSSYCSCYFSIWGGSVEKVEKIKADFLNLVGDALVRDPMFSIDWHFLTSKGELESVTIEEFADDVLCDEAYPELEDGVASFIEDYLSAEETVLVLQGPPGTGKTRLIRAILGGISAGKVVTRLRCTRATRKRWRTTRFSFASSPDGRTCSSLKMPITFSDPGRKATKTCTGF